MTTTPLDAEALDALFTMDPVLASDATFDALILEVRRRRNSFAAAEAAKEAKGKSRTPRAAPIPDAQRVMLEKPPSEVTLDDLLGEGVE